MADAHIVHTLSCSEDTFWKLFFDLPYNEALFLRALGFESWKVVSQDEKPDAIERVVDVIPKIGDLPGPLKKLVEGGVGYRERGRFARAEKSTKIEIEPTVMQGKLTITGRLYTESEGDRACRRIYDTTVTAKLFGIGGMVESRILADVKASYDKAAEFTNQWVKEKGL